MGGIGPLTSSLPMKCSATELHQQDKIYIITAFIFCQDMLFALALIL